MRHSAILRAAIAAAYGASNTQFVVGDQDSLQDLYAYARARKFPPAETLARRHFELTAEAGPFPYARLADAPEMTRIFYTVFAAVAAALELFHEEDDATSRFMSIVPPAADRAPKPKSKKKRK